MRRCCATATCSASSSPPTGCWSAPRSISITLLHPPGYDYYRLLRSKLHWGRGGYDDASAPADCRQRALRSAALLTYLRIRDFAIIDELELELGAG